MAKVFEEITDHLRDWIARQPLFFVASAPLEPEGHVNVSPKGPIGSLAVLGPRTVAYLDVHGSGAETVAHLRENGRICVMLCAFEGPPRIVRLHGRGEAVLNDDPRFEGLLAQGDFEDASIPAARRSIVRGRDRPDQRLVRVRRAVDELRGPPRAPRPVVGEEGQDDGCRRV